MHTHSASSANASGADRPSPNHSSCLLYTSLDRATLWNAVESCEKHPKAQLAYSFDIAMQNELTLEENMERARKFVQERCV